MSERAEINIYNADSLAAMKKMPDNAYSLCIADPPYGIGVNVSMGRRKGQAHSGYHKFAGADSAAPPQEYFDELMRVSVNQIIWGANHFISKMPIDSPCWAMWDKGFSDEVTFAQFELAWTSFKTTCKKFDKSPIDRARIHPTQKPVALYKWLLANYAKPGDKIVDTHGGSCSLAIACWDMGFDLDAWELDADYYAAAVARLEKHKRQGQFDL